MALVLKDRVKETSVSTGTGAITLDGATGAYQPFSVIGNGNQTYYAIAGQTTNEWEVGIGTYTLSTDTLSRDTILSSSNSNTIVNFSAGTKDVFITYPSEKAIYEEPSGETLINAGPITVIGNGVTSIPSLPAELGKFIGDVDSFAQIYTLNQNDGSTASADLIAYNDLTTDGFTYFTDMGISSSNYTSVDYPIFTPNSGYIFHQGADFFIGNQTTNKDIKFFSGGVDVTDLVATFSGTDRSASFEADVNVGGALDVTGAATFGSTVLLDANPTLALQAATKQYVDEQVTAGIHIHEPVRVETTGNLTATYVQGGTTFNITAITGTNTVTTSVNHGLSVNDQIWLTTTAGNGLSINIAYFVFSIPALNQLTLSLTYDGTQITGLTNATGLTYATRANSGIGATLTNAGTQVALNVDGIALSVGNRVMVRLQTNGAENGVYVVTTLGSGSTNWVLTRATDASFVSPSDPDGLGTGDYFFTQEGVLNAGDSHVLTTEPNTMIIGYTTLTYTQFSGSVDYVGGTNINITGQTISLTGTVAATNGGTGTSTVTTGDLLYGSGTNTWSKLPVGSAFRSLVVNSSGTQVEWNAVALNQTGAVSGSLGATNGGTGQSAYTLGDIIYSGATDTLTKLAGNTTTTKQYLSQTGTGSASAAPSWATISAADIGAGTLPAVRGGTGQSSYSIGDILYADTTTSLARLADVAVGNALISGGLNAAPAWGKIALASAVSGTLGIANGGTGQTTANAAFNALVPSQTGNSGRYLTTNGTDTSWGTISAVSTISFGTTGLTPNTATSGAVVVSGTLAIANGGTGETTRQAAMDALAGATTSGQYLRGNGTDVVMANIVAGDVPTLNQNTTGTAGGLSGSPSISVGTVTTTAGSAAIPAITTTGDTNTGIFFPAADTIAFTEGGTESMRIDSSGNLGLGVTPSAWSSSYRALQFGSQAILSSVITGTQASQLGLNWYADSGGTARYIGTGNASLYNQYSGQHVWYTAPSGTAGNAITFTQAMTLDASGRLGVGTTGPRQQLSVGANLDLYSGSVNSPTVPSVRGSAGNNLILSGFGSGAVFLNFDGGTGGVNFCNGAGSGVASVSSSGGLSATTGSFGGNVSLGTSVTGATATPSQLNTGLNYSNGYTRDKCKIYLYNTGVDQYGFGIGPAGDIQYHSQVLHDFYISNTKVGSFGSGGLTATLLGNATTATGLNSSNYITRTGSSGNLNTDFQNTPAGTTRIQGDDANLSNSPGNTWWFYQNMRHSNASNFWGTQVAWGWEDNANRLATRNITAGSFGGWIEYLNTSGRTFSGNLLMSGDISAGSASTAGSVNLNVINSSGTTSFGTQGTSTYGTLNAGDAFVYTTKHVVLVSDSGSGAIKFATNGATERMRITAAGNVGIGTNAPDGRLDVAGNATLRGDGNNAYLSFVVPFGRGYFAYGVSSGNTFDMYNVQNGPIRFYTNSTERMRIDGNGNLNFNSGFGSAGLAFGCRAWVNFNGQGTIAIRGSGNVSSITDIGTGQYGINFSTAMPDANYSGTGMFGRGATNNDGHITVNNANPPTASAFTVSASVSTGNTLFDPLYVLIQVVR